MKRMISSAAMTRKNCPAVKRSLIAVMAVTGLMCTIQIPANDDIPARKSGN